MIFLDQLKTSAIRVINGSVKDIYVLTEATDDQPGEGIAVFSDRISVFDWGPLPFEIPNKGASLCLQSALFFEQAEAAGIKTHYLGLVDKVGNTVKLKELKDPTNMMRISLCQVKKPVFKDGIYDYSGFNKLTNNFVIAGEFIYRRTLPTGSSVFTRLTKGTLTYQALGLDHYPVEGEVLPKAFLELTTKMEKTDRSISWQNLADIYDFDQNIIDALKEKMLILVEITTEIARRAEFENCDGKFEFAFLNGEIAVVDAGATMDECRFTTNVDGEIVQVSKEIFRQWYIPTPWKTQVDEAKKKAAEMGIEDWQSLCPPPPIPPYGLQNIGSNLYMSSTNNLLQRHMFGCLPLSHTLRVYKSWKSDLKN
jgi:phosphoribosylaminoimidazole-succinocarboxamide synthase